MSVQEIGGVVPDNVMNELGKALGVKDQDSDTEMEDVKGGVGGGFGQVRKAVEKVVREGYSAVQILSQVKFLFSSLSLERKEVKADCESG